MLRKLIDDIKEAQECVHDIGGTPLADIVTTCDQADMCLGEALAKIAAIDEPPNLTPMRFENWLLMLNEAWSDYDTVPDEQLTFTQFIDRVIKHFC